MRLLRYPLVWDPSPRYLSYIPPYAPLWDGGDPKTKNFLEGENRLHFLRDLFFQKLFLEYFAGLIEVDIGVEV